MSNLVLLACIPIEKQQIINDRIYLIFSSLLFLAGCNYLNWIWLDMLYFPFICHCYNFLTQANIYVPTNAASLGLKSNTHKVVTKYVSFYHFNTHIQLIRLIDSAANQQTEMNTFDVLYLTLELKKNMCIYKWQARWLDILKEKMVNGINETV